MFRIQLTESFQANLFSLGASNQTITVSSFNLICIINSHSQQTEEMGLGQLDIWHPHSKVIVSKILIWFWWKGRLGSWLIIILFLTDLKMGYLLWSTKRWLGSREGLVWCWHKLKVLPSHVHWLTFSTVPWLLHSFTAGAAYIMQELSLTPHLSPSSPQLCFVCPALSLAPHNNTLTKNQETDSDSLLCCFPSLMKSLSFSFPSAHH